MNPKDFLTRKFGPPLGPKAPVVLPTAARRGTRDPGPVPEEPRRTRHRHHKSTKPRASEDCRNDIAHLLATMAVPHPAPCIGGSAPTSGLLNVGWPGTAGHVHDASAATRYPGQAHFYHHQMNACKYPPRGGNMLCSLLPQAIMDAGRAHPRTPTHHTRGPSESKMNAAIMRCFENLQPGTQISQTQIEELNKILQDELVRVRDLKQKGQTVTQTLHDLLNELTGSHVPIDQITCLAESLCHAYVSKSDGRSRTGRDGSSSGSRSSSQSSSSSTSLSSTYSERQMSSKHHRRLPKLVRKTSLRLEQGLNAIAAENPAPAVPRGSGSALTGPVDALQNNKDRQEIANELMLAQQKWQEEKEKMQQWADEMRQHYEEQKLRMKEEFNESLNDLRTRLTSQQNIADSSLQSEYANRINELERQLERAEDEAQSLRQSLNTAQEASGEASEYLEKVRKLENEKKVAADEHSRKVQDLENKVAEFERRLQDRDTRAMSVESSKTVIVEQMKAALEESMKQMAALEDQTRKIKEENVSALETRSKFKEEMHSVEAKLSELSDLIGDLSTEADLGEYVHDGETEGHRGQRVQDALNEASIRVDLAESEAFRLREINKMMVKKAKKYRALWRKHCERVEQMETLADQVVRDRLDEETRLVEVERGLGEIRQRALEQDEEVTACVMKLRHFADVAGKYAKDAENLRDALRKSLAIISERQKEAELVKNEKEQLSIELNKTKAAYQEKERAVKEALTKLENLKESSEYHEQQYTQIRTENLNSQVDLEALRRSLETTKTEATEWKRKYDMDVVNSEKKRQEFEALTTRLEQQIAQQKQTAQLLEEELQRRETMWRTNVETLESKLKEEYSKPERFAVPKSASPPVASMPSKQDMMRSSPSRLPQEAAKTLAKFDELLSRVMEQVETSQVESKRRHDEQTRRKAADNDEKTSMQMEADGYIEY